MRRTVLSRETLYFNISYTERLGHLKQKELQTIIEKYTRKEVEINVFELFLDRFTTLFNFESFFPNRINILKNGASEKLEILHTIY
jgi:glycosylphosphatidylinositol transamidase (GPIT) subunit GPI8